MMLQPMLLLNKLDDKTTSERNQSRQLKPAKEFLAKNKLKPEVKTTASGLQYEVITEGTGIKPTAVDTFVAHYRGTLIDGTEFDASYNRGQAIDLSGSQGYSADGQKVYN